LLPAFLWLGAMMIVRQYALGEQQFDLIKNEIREKPVRGD
jgi:Na+/melibiose symporter-like transporter